MCEPATALGIASLVVGAAGAGNQAHQAEKSEDQAYAQGEDAKARAKKAELAAQAAIPRPRRKDLPQAGYSSTLLTGAGGLQPPTTGGNRVLGA